MKFFHVYDAACFQGLVENNFINEDTGFKIQHAPTMEDAAKFNCVAARGAALHSLLKQGKYPFYVDRQAGGLRYHSYDFDKSLIAEYRELLGDWFLGFQLHELLGNRAADWRRIAEAVKESGLPYGAEMLKKSLFSPEYVMPNNTPIYHLTQGSPEEYGMLELADTEEKFRRDLEWVISKRLREADGELVGCDSGHQTIYMQNRLGVKTFMPELGCQTPHSRMAVALARGMARAYGKKWGTYYECWVRNGAGGNYTKPVYDPEAFNEWHSRQDQFVDDFTSGGANAGSSRLLQRRIYYYSLMSGAHFMAEEWGLNCSYMSTKTFELSPYGLLKKEFIEFARKHKRVKATVPFAIVLPVDYDSVQLFSCGVCQLGEKPAAYMTLALTPERAERIGKIQDVLNFVFKRDPNAKRGNEGHAMQNSRFGDLFDIVYADAPRAALAQYDRLVDADPTGEFARKMRGDLAVLPAEDLGALEAVLKVRAAEILPVTADNLHWLLSEDEHARYITVFNNEGNNRNLQEGDCIDHEADAVTNIRVKPGVELEVLYASSADVRLEKIGEREYSLFVPATDFVILKY